MAASSRTRDGVFELQRQTPELHAGERWQMTLRLKAPHGNSNPHGFDYELWLWEQGLQATGYVRSGPRDTPPQRLGGTWRHPVERARQDVRDRIFEHVSDRKTAGLIAALVVGDQNAIDRADWDIFRATGVAHLMSISGLHITMFAWAAALLVGALWRRSRAPVPRVAGAACGARRRDAAGGRLCAFQRLGRAVPAHHLDAGRRRPVAAVGAALALRQQVGCSPARWWWRSIPGRCCRPGSG